MPHEPASNGADLGDQAVQLAQELVRIDSVNPGLVPGAAGERAIVEHLAARLDAAGFTTTTITPPGHPDRPSLLAISPAAAGPTLVLTGHLDTVGVDGMEDAFEGRIEGERLHGRGASDMKAGLAGLVVAAEELARRGARLRTVLALVSDEEDRSLGCEAVIAALPELGLHPDAALVAEPTWLARTRSLRGFAVIEVTFRGRAAHSSQPAEGVNAVTHLGRLLAAVESRGRAVAESGGSLMVTLAQGGESMFVLARRARAVIERRTVPGESAAGALQEVQELLDQLTADDPSIDAQARLLTSRDAWQLDTSGAATALADALDEQWRDLAPAEPLDAPYWMEAPLWQDAGIPALVCGPAGGGLHAADEWMDLHQLRRFTTGLVAAIDVWAADAAR